MTRVTWCRRMSERFNDGRPNWSVWEIINGEESWICSGCNVNAVLFRLRTFNSVYCQQLYFAGFRSRRQYTYKIIFQHYTTIWEFLGLMGNRIFGIQLFVCFMLKKGSDNSFSISALKLHLLTSRMCLTSVEIFPCQPHEFVIAWGSNFMHHIETLKIAM